VTAYLYPIKHRQDRSIKVGCRATGIPLEGVWVVVIEFEHGAIAYAHDDPRPAPVSSRSTTPCAFSFGVR